METAIITGATKGIGKEIAKALLKRGYTVLGIGRSFHEDIEGSFHFIEIDLKDYKALSNKIKEIDKEYQISLLINNAGVGYFDLHEHLSPLEIHEMVSVNLEAPMIMTNMLLRNLKRNKGTIINISSVSGIKDAPRGAAYGAAKAGLIHFSNSLFEEVRKYGVQVINISPDMTMTDFYHYSDFTPAKEEGMYLQAEKIGEITGFIIDNKDHALITDITIRPQYNKIERKPKNS